MLRLTLKNLWAYKVRLTLTGVAVVLGVAFMAGTMVLTDTMDRTFDTMFETANAGTDVVVRRPSPVESQQVQTRERVPAELVEKVGAVKGVAVAKGAVTGFAQLVQSDGTLSSTRGGTVTIGTNWIDDEDLNAFSLDSGRSPRAGDEVVIDKATAETQGWAIGDEVEVMAMGEPVKLRLVGIAGFGDIGGLPGASLVAVDDEVAQRYFAAPGYYDSIVVRAGEGVESEALRSEIDSALGFGVYEVVTGEADTADKKSKFAENLGFFNTFLMAFAFISLFVGTFIIYNTFSILVAQRTKDNAMLRAIGASRRQVRWAALCESAAVGVLAAGVGLGLGVAMSFGLRALLGAVGIDLPEGETVVAMHTIVTSFVVGVGVSVVSAVGPVIRASLVAPIAALRGVASDRSAASFSRAVVGILMTSVGGLAFAGGVIGAGENPLMLLALGTLAVFGGVFVLGPVIARPIVVVLAIPVTLLGGAVGRIARDNAVRSPKRTAATSSSLMVGVALVGFITILAASAKASVDEAIDKTMRADFVIESGAAGQGGFSPELAARLSQIPGVEAVSTYRSSPAEVDGKSVFLDSVNTATIDQLYDLEAVEGAIGDVGPGEIAINKNRAAESGTRIGDTLKVRFSGGEVMLKVAAIYRAQFPEGGFLVDNSTLEAHVTDRYDKKVFVSMVDTVSPEAARATIQGVTSSYPNADIQDQAGFKHDITSRIDSMLNLVYGLLGLAVLIALMGIANTLALSVHERRREIGLLRAVGMTRGQVRSAVRRESVLIALLGVVLGTVLAVASAWGIAHALKEDMPVFEIPQSQLVVIAAMAAAAGVLAAFGPARRASKLDVLDAIAE